MSSEPVIALFGQVTRDRILHVSKLPEKGGNAVFDGEQIVHGGVVTWAGRSVVRAGGHAIMLGVAGADVPLNHIAETGRESHRVDDRLLRNGSGYRIDVLVTPDGQRTFLAPRVTSETYPLYEIPEVPPFDGLILDGYSVLPGRHRAVVEDLVTSISSRNRSPKRVVVVLPDASLLHPVVDVYREQMHRFTGLDGISLWIIGDPDEQELLGDGSWRSVTTTGLERTDIFVSLGNGSRQKVSVEMDPPVNTNGAGDTFAGAFLTQLCRAGEPRNAVYAGHVAASAHVSGTKK